MKSEKVALVALIVIVAVVLSAVILAQPSQDGTGTVWDDIFKNFSSQSKLIAYGDCVDVNYIGRYVSNGTIFDSSYNDTDNKVGGAPLNIFVAENQSQQPPSGYSAYTSNFLEGFIDGLVGLQEGDEATIGPIPPEEAYGVPVQEGNTFDIPIDEETSQTYEVYTIEEDQPMPIDLQPYLGTGTTSLITLRETWHSIGEIIESKYLSWDNSTVVTAINETHLWMYTTPTTDVGENFTWISEMNPNTGEQYTFPENSTKVTSLNDTTILVRHNPVVNATIDVSYPYSGVVGFTIDNMTEDTIYASYTQGNNTESKTFNRLITIERNETTNITLPALPAEYIEQALFSYLRQIDPDFKYSFHRLAGETLEFDVTIEEVYKCSES